MRIFLLPCIVAVSLLLLLPVAETMVSTNNVSLFSAKAHAYYGTGRRIARRTARRTARRVSRRHAYYRGGAPVVYGAPVAAATIAIGATVASLPPACQSVVVNGVTYYNCGGTYYQAAYDGPNLVYVVVAPPR